MARVTIRSDRPDKLPSLCVCCGRPATRMRRQEFRIEGAASAAVLTASVMLGALAWTERGVSLALPVCDYHRRRGRRSTRTLVRGTGLTAILGAGAYLSSFASGEVANYLGVAAMFAFIITIVVGMHEVDDGLRVRCLTPTSLTLTGVHRAFAEAVAATGPGTEMSHAMAIDPPEIPGGM
jgi:hypothetical protein